MNYLFSHRADRSRANRPGSEQAFFEKLEDRNLLAANVVSGLDPAPLVFNLAQPVPVVQSLDVLKSHLQLGDNESMRLAQLTEDHLGYTHLKYQQYYDDLQVLGATYTVHSIEGQIVRLSGDRVRLNDPPLSGGISEDQAFDLALGHIDADRYIWQHADQPESIELRSGHADKAISDSGFAIPHGQLVYLGGGTDHAASLAFQFDIYAIQPLSRDYVYVDAVSGEIVETRSRIHTADTAANGTSLYNGTVDFTADGFSGGFRLRQVIDGVETYDLNNGTNYGAASDIVSPSTSFSALEVQIGVQAHWATEQTFQYFLQEHSRDSFDDNGSVLKSYVSYGVNYVNAFWDGTRMTYGDGNGSSYFPLVSLDIVGHEIAHGVTQFSANLIYQNQSGALNESFSDIFGESVENFATGTNDWLMGDNIGPGGANGAFRNMANPKLKGDPDTYQGEFWHTGSNDYGGVHTNSGVQNKWFYILSVGQAGTNDTGHTYDVTGIGMGAAAEIAYRNLTTYLTTNSQYIDARQGGIQSAIDLFGRGSAEHLATVAAWDAVGVYDEGNLELVSMANGSMVYRGLITDQIQAIGVENEYQIDLDGGQLLSVLVNNDTAALNTQVRIENSSGTEIASSTNFADLSYIQSMPIDVTDTYTIFVDATTADEFTFEVILNAAGELNSDSLPDNQTQTNAQSIESSLTVLGQATHNANSLALVGSFGGGDGGSGGGVIDSEDFESGSLDSRWTTFSSDNTGRIIVTDFFDAPSGDFSLFMDQEAPGDFNLNEATWTVDLSSSVHPILSFYHNQWDDENDTMPDQFTLHANADGVAISADGTNWHTIFTDGFSLPGIFEFVQVDLQAAASDAGIALGADFQIKFQQYDDFSFSSDGRGYDAISIDEGSGGQDWYTFDLSADEIASLAAVGASSLQIELYDAAGSLLAIGAPGINVDTYIDRFENATGSASPYYARVTDSANSTYTLFVTRGAALDLEDNAAASPQDINGLAGALGFLGAEASSIAEPDDFPDGTLLDNAFSGMTLSNPVTGGSIYAVSTAGAYTPPTGTNIFNPNDTGHAGFQRNVNELRADFDAPQLQVSIDIGSDDAGDVGFLDAYDVDGNLLERVLSARLSEGQSETLTITRQSAEIAFITAGGWANDVTPLDHLAVSGFAPEQDVYVFEVVADMRIEIDAYLPGRGPGKFDNPLDGSSGSQLRIDLLDPSGTVVASGSDSIRHQNTEAGQYRLVVYSNLGTSGEYYVQYAVTEPVVGYDFGPAESPIATNYIGVGADLFDPAVGYGWQGLRGLSARDNTRGNDLTGDRVQAINSTFMIDVANGSYDVDVHFGFALHVDDVFVNVENTGNDVFVPSVNSDRSYTVNVTDGQLNIQFHGNFGNDGLIRASGVRITPSGGLPLVGKSAAAGLIDGRAAVLATGPQLQPARFPSGPQFRAQADLLERQPAIESSAPQPGLPSENSLRDVAIEYFAARQKRIVSNDIRRTITKIDQPLRLLDEALADMFLDQIKGDSG